AAVAVLDIADAGDTIEELHGLGAKAQAFAVDLTEPAQVERAAAEVAASLGPADILVNNAGIYPNQPIDGMAYADWRRMFAINVDSMFLTTQAFTPAMKARG